MKVAVVLLPAGAKCNVVTNGASENAPLVLMLGRLKVLLVLLALPALAAVLLAGGVYFSRIPVPWKVQSTMTAELGGPLASADR